MKKRLDLLVYEKGFAQSREKAKVLIMAGNVYVQNQKQDKSGSLFDENSIIEVRQNTLKYVSRGGLKLEKAISVFNIDLKEKVAMDIGSSTGGFTDCMLQNGAKKVYAVDVGYGQLDWSLRQSEKVVTLERTNIRHLEKEKVLEDLDFFSVDVSFISLKLVLPAAIKFLNSKAQGVCLIKPQFEAGRQNVGKNGVVRENSVHIDVIKQTINYAHQNGFGVTGLDFSPIKGPKGNIEYLLFLKRSSQDLFDCDENFIKTLVKKSHDSL